MIATGFSNRGMGAVCRIGRVAWIAGALWLAGGCALVKIETDPPGAEVYYSRNGLRPWQAWPPGSDAPRRAPLSSVIWKSGVYLARASQDGYRMSSPVVVEAHRFGIERVHIVLEPDLNRPNELSGQSMTSSLALIDAAPSTSTRVVASRDATSPTARMTLPPRDAVSAEPFEIDTASTTEAAQVKRIADLADQVFTQGGDRDASPTLLANLEGWCSRFKILNGAGNELRVVISGPGAAYFNLAPYEARGLELPPGEYRIALSESADDTSPSLIQIAMKAGDWYYHAHRRIPIAPKPLEEEVETFKNLINAPTPEIPTYVRPETPGEKPARPDGQRGGERGSRGGEGQPGGGERRSRTGGGPDGPPPGGPPMGGGPPMDGGGPPMGGGRGR